MSLFLGKIHFLLFNKIKHFESMEERILDLAEKSNMPIKEWIYYCNLNFGEKTSNKPLEEIIDKDNIHGWLEDKIKSAEKRSAYYITRILEKDKNLKKNILSLYEKEGKKYAKEVFEKVDKDNILELYKTLNNYLLEGMPCDRLNEIIASSSEKLSWKLRKDVHEAIWNSIGGDVSNFHDFRNEYIKNFIYEINPDLYFVLGERGEKIILKR